jgi:hypothetical protein
MKRTTDDKTLELLLQWGRVRARTTALRDALDAAELNNRTRRCLRACRRFNRNGKPFDSAVLRGMAKGYKEVALGPLLGLARR